jgi:archaetidylinositol phosphate synthase
MVEPPTGSAENAGNPVVALRDRPLSGRSETRKPRPGRELLCEYVFRPLAQLVVRVLLPLRVAPTTVVVVHCLVGLAAAGLLASGAFVAAAVLLQVKTVLDNADGQLARASDRVTATGRYLDTECDAIVNVALFVALGAVTGEPVLALVSFAALTAVLTTDYNMELLYRQAHGDPHASTLEPAGAGGTLARIYAAVFAPQDRLVGRVVRARLSRITRGADTDAHNRAARAYHDRPTLTILANLGLSTQLAVLGLLLVVGAPEAYLWCVLACGLTLPILHLRRELSARRALVR